jgi:hypothetical protein
LISKVDFVLRLIGFADDDMSRPVIIVTSKRVGVIGPWEKRKVFKAVDQK